MQLKSESQPVSVHNNISITLSGHSNNDKQVSNDHAYKENYDFEDENEDNFEDEDKDDFEDQNEDDFEDQNEDDDEEDENEDDDDEDKNNYYEYYHKKGKIGNQIRTS
ncbi:hypothetical protein HMI54_009071 [Coelomomyces lativittatus]|nr:hypothetical protein HMI55_006486 [Coelomomyces lativittatus]KAJ1516539.1 hypothetical protein HMI54_009071 [Coelomomyces lativittatus]